MRTLAPLFGISLLISAAWFLRNAVTYGPTDPFGWARHDLVVAGQPTTGQWIAEFSLYRTVQDFITISFRSFWGQFGWMGVLMDERVYFLLLGLSLAASAGALLWLFRLVRERWAFPAEIRWTWLLLCLLVALAFSAHVYYNFKFFQPQGRYLFPGLVPIAALWAAGLSELVNARYARLIFGALYVLMLTIDFAALTLFIVPQLGY
jgi:hypothetical protein